jgi:hypothetical protein
MRERSLSDQATSNFPFTQVEPKVGGGEEMRIIEADVAMPMIQVAKAV